MSLMAKRVLGVLSLLISPVVPYAFYSHVGKARSEVDLFLNVVGAVAIVFLAFALARRLWRQTAWRILFGGMLSYAGLAILAAIGGAVHGQLAETLMWMPVILLFGIPVMTPLVILVGFATFMILVNATVPKPSQKSVSDNSAGTGAADKAAIQ